MHKLFAYSVLFLLVSFEAIYSITMAPKGRGIAQRLHIDRDEEKETIVDRGRSTLTKRVAASAPNSPLDFLT